MHKKFLRFLVAALALSLCLPSAGAVNTNRDGDVMVRVGLASSSSHVPQGEMESANLENNNSAGYGEGFRFGYYDGDLDFVELARTEEDVIAVSVLKTQNLSYSAGENTYSSAGDGRVEVGCYHLLIEDGLRDYRGGPGAGRLLPGRLCGLDRRGVSGPRRLLPHQGGRGGRL